MNEPSKNKKMDVRVVATVGVITVTAVAYLFSYLFLNEREQPQQYGSQTHQHRDYSHDIPRRRGGLQSRRGGLQSRRGRLLSRRVQGEKKERDELTRKDDRCSICLDSLKQGIILFTKCDHQFHLKCLREWVKQEACCPLCKSPVNLHETE